MQRKIKLMLATVLAVSLLLAIMLFGAFWQSTPVFASDASVAIAQTDPAHGCDDGDATGSASTESGEPGDDCDDENAYGRIVKFPEGGGAGLWVIGANTYTVTEETRLEQEYGAFAVGKCVEVEWAVEEPGVALKIESKPDYKCNGNDDGDHGSESEFFGFVSALPDDPALLGVWTVGTITFTVNVTTELDTRQGDFVVGAFVKVHFNEVQGAKVAHEVRTVGGPADDDDDHGEQHWRHANAFGPIETMPVSGTIGSWVIGGVPYSVTEFTRLKANNGALEVGAFVKVQYFKNQAGNRIASKIQTTDDHAGGSPGEYRFVGTVEEKPVAFVGNWTISGATFVTTDTTVFNEAKGLLIVGASVAVRYVITNDMRLASEIRTIVPPGGGDHHHVGRIDHSGTSSVADASAASADGKAANIWTIGGQDFAVTPGTLLDDEFAALEVGGVAYVNSYAETDGTLVATSIEGMPADLQQFLPMLQR